VSLHGACERFFVLEDEDVEEKDSISHTREVALTPTISSAQVLFLGDGIVQCRITSLIYNLRVQWKTGF